MGGASSIAGDIVRRCLQRICRWSHNSRIPSLPKKPRTSVRGVCHDPFNFMLNHTEDIDEQNFYVEKFDTLDGTHWEIALDIQQQIQEILDHEAEEQSWQYPVLITPENLNPPTVQRLNLQLSEGGAVTSIADYDTGDSLNTIIDNVLIRIACSGFVSVMPLFSCPSDPGLVCIPYETNHTMDIVVAYHGK